jgi:hypothetical protein
MQSKYSMQEKENVIFEAVVHLIKQLYDYSHD